SQAEAYANKPQYQANDAMMGPLGKQSVMDTPASVTGVPQDLIVNQQARTVNDTLRFLPSVEVRDQQGLEVSRPQSRGFQGSIVQNTRLDGLNTVGTTAIAAENLSQVQVLNGLGGSLYGPETPAGVFNYVLKRPTEENLMRFVEGFDGKGVWTEQADLGGRLGDNGQVGYRLNAVHGEGESYVSGSHVNRNLAAGDFDFHLDQQTVIEADLSHYRTNITGLPGSIVYDTNKGSNSSNSLPAAVDPTRVGYGQPGAGTDLKTDTGLVKLKHAFNEHWSIEAGVLYQDAVRNLFGITNTLLDNKGDYTVTKNFTAVPHFTIASNLLYLNGQFDAAGLKNDFTFGTNGFVNNQYSYKNSIAVSNPAVLNLANPQVLAFPATPDNGGEYKSGRLTEQSIVIGDTLHFNEQWALQGVLNRSDITSESYDKTSAVTSRNESDGEYSPTLSLLYKPLSTLTTYATAARSVEQGEQAPAGTANVNQFLGLYHDRQYEVGAKYAASDSLLLTVAAFHMTRPLATTNAANVFAVAGTQTNNGLELFAQGNLQRDLSIFGGVTYIDAKLNGTDNPATDDKLVVGVPRTKADVALDYHPGFAAGFALTGALHYESTRAATNTNNSFAPSYVTLDAGVRYATALMEKHHATMRLQLLNATDKHYYSSIADGNIVGSPGANTAYLGAPRTLMASLELDY
ncbi:MAG TPA: TonB-dependent siderophore receptor, partial [Janthinobacterium sp.]|nr:TonB-dependent siderophore receptor [Janthinobacterium sp.]